MTDIPRLQAYPGPPLLSYGFRPFFLFGSLYAAVAMLLWLPFYSGEVTLTTSFVPRDWHAHEMIYGYLPAVITGFLLTAIPNWTGRLPLQGSPLLLLVCTWAVGRLAVAVSSKIGWISALLLDGSFLFLLAAAATREIIAGRNWRNLKVLLPVLVLGLGNVAFHLEAQSGTADYGTRVGVSAILLLLMLIGGRIIPSFTGNWLRRQTEGRLPAPFDRFDLTVLSVSGTALSYWIAYPTGLGSTVLLTTAGALHVARLVRWAGDRTLSERLVLILHVAYAFIPIGFFMSAAEAQGAILPSAGIHAWLVGGAGVMTVAVMTRATLGHTDRPLLASLGTQVIYACIVIAAATRVCAALEPQHQVVLLHMAGVAWIVGFAAFAALYGPLLWRKRHVER